MRQLRDEQILFCIFVKSNKKCTRVVFEQNLPQTHLWKFRGEICAKKNVHTIIMQIKT